MLAALHPTRFRVIAQFRGIASTTLMEASTTLMEASTA
jgi:hypothetical protein